MNKLIFLILVFSRSLFLCTAQTPAEKYKEVQTRLQSGWGTFNYKNVMSHVLLPEGFSMNIGIKLRGNFADNYLREACISSRGNRPEKIIPGYKSYDGSYSELSIEWNGVVFRIESATTPAQDIIILVTPVRCPDKAPSVILETGMLWNRAGEVKRNGNTILVNTVSRKLTVRTSGIAADEYLPNTGPYLAVRFDSPVAFYTGDEKSIETIILLVKNRRKEMESQFARYGNLAATCQAIQSVIGWNVIYDASKNRVIYPVSRMWIDYFGGQFVLFDWDTYFSAWMASMGSRDLAYANAVEITKSITPAGFIPNFAGSYGSASYDRSQPPVGSLVFREIYRKYREKWLLEYVFNDLLTWNRWWPKNRDHDGLLCWGSNPVDPPLSSDFATNTWQGAAYESGLDNSPMFDSIKFNAGTHMLELADAGLTGLYVMDCDALGDIATILGKDKESKELKARADFYRKNLGSLWNSISGIYENKGTDNGVFSPRHSPINFYPMLARAPDQSQAVRMAREHLLNPEEFYGEWMIPSIARNDKAFREQDYWRGRIWGPMNFLVYLGLLNYDLPEARKVVAEKSNKLLMDNVRLNGYVYENYNAITGNITDPAEGRLRGDNYYHWGALLGFISMIEQGYVDNPSKPVQ